MFTDKRHSGGGIVSTVLGVSGLAAIIYDIVRIYLTGGRVTATQTVSAALAFIYGAVGLMLGIWMYLRRDSFVLFPALGIALNVVLLLIIALLLLWGAMV